MDIARDAKNTTFLSANWKSLQKMLEEEKVTASTSNEKPNKATGGFISVVAKRKRKVTEEVKASSSGVQENIWKKRRAEVMEAASAKKDPEEKEAELTKIIALDCEFVGVGIDGLESMLARVSIVNVHGHCLYDKYVKPTQRITDFRYEFSGIRPEDLINGEPFKKVQLEVSKLIAGRIVVGHAVYNDFKVLGISHPRLLTRDTFKYPPLKKAVGKVFPGLKVLAKDILGISIQEGKHNSLVDAQAALKIYLLYQKQWEKDIRKLKRN